MLQGRTFQSITTRSYSLSLVRTSLCRLLVNLSSKNKLQKSNFRKKKVPMTCYKRLNSRILMKSQNKMVVRLRLKGKVYFVTGSTNHRTLEKNSLTRKSTLNLTLEINRKNLLLKSNLWISQCQVSQWIEKIKKKSPRLIYLLTVWRLRQVLSNIYCGITFKRSENSTTR